MLETSAPGSHSDQLFKIRIPTRPGPSRHLAAQLLGVLEHLQALNLFLPSGSLPGFGWSSQPGRALPPLQRTLGSQDLQDCPGLGNNPNTEERADPVSHELGSRRKASTGTHLHGSSPKQPNCHSSSGRHPRVELTPVAHTEPDGRTARPPTTPVVEH
ncbi:hypothetical protein T4E_2248 [Trichinella pseudospiralis]|uniref:Uncharacterized protein n=1 Tax=Trichinella pseudospiralis TaxID=6337 RepID=A0A0V0XGJ8_TRIPS|nr:hypothetical protein T4E_2248 [Trichinella pseudospiralis]